MQIGDVDDKARCWLAMPFIFARDRLPSVIENLLLATHTCVLTRADCIIKLDGRIFSQGTLRIFQWLGRHSAGVGLDQQMRCFRLNLFCLYAKSICINANYYKV